MLGTLIGAILAIPFAFLAATNIMPKPVAYLFRVITQSVCSIGMISKMYITAIEYIDRHKNITVDKQQWLHVLY